MSNFIEERRLGKFSVSTRLIRDSDPQKTLAFMGNFLVIRAECMYFNDTIEYDAYSPLFHITDAGDSIPEYRITIHSDGRVEAQEIP